jgi:hypothetical protein
MGSKEEGGQAVVQVTGVALGTGADGAGQTALLLPVESCDEGWIVTR